MKNGKHGTAELRFRGTEKFSACSQKEDSKNKNYVDMEVIDAVHSGMTREEKEVSYAMLTRYVNRDETKWLLVITHFIEWVHPYINVIH